MGSYSSSFVLMDSTASLRVLIGPYPFLWIPMGTYMFLCVLIDSNGCY